MKKALRILAISLASLLIIALILPFLFKGKIVAMVKDSINENIHATVDFSGISLSLFRQFPNLSIRVKNLTVINHAPFEGDTLARIPSLGVTIDLLGLLKGAPYEIKRINLDAPDIRLRVLVDGRVNWDIAKASEETDTSESAETDEGFTLALRRLQLNDGKLLYDDRSLPVRVTASGLTHRLSGDLSMSRSILKTHTSASALTVNYDGITYLSNAKARVITDIMANLDAYIFEFQDGEVFINDLKILANGWFSMPDEGYGMDINFNAPGTDFREALSLVPALYAKDFEKLRTSGSFSLSGNVKGLYSETSMPGFSLDLRVQDARFQYPDLPSSVEDIQIQCRIENPDGDPDRTIIDLSKLHLVMAGTPVDATLLLKTPVSDPDVKATLKGALNLADVAGFYPLEDTKLSGEILADVNVAGRMSMIDRKEYERFIATGTMTAKDVVYAYAEEPEWNIPGMKLTFSPAALRLEEFRLSMGQSSFSARGELSQYLGWMLRDETLKGSLTLISPRMDMNELLGSEDEPPAQPASEEAGLALSAPDIPGNIDFTVVTQVAVMIFGDLELEAVRGQMIIRDGRLSLNDIYARAFDGEIRAAGFYAKSAGTLANMNMSLALDRIDISQAYETSGLMRKLAPVARHTRGKVSTSLEFSGLLDEQLNPIYPSLDGQGRFTTTSIIVAGLPVMHKIADAISMDALREAVLQPVQASFVFTDGKVEVKPFDIKLNDITANVSGSTGFDQSLSYVMKMQAPRSALGAGVDALVSGWVAQAAGKGFTINPGTTLNLDILIGGTIQDPVIRTGLSGMAESMKEEIMQAISEKVEEVKAEIKQEVTKLAEEYLREAEKQAAAIMEQARKQAETVKSAAAEAARKIRQEADAQANKIIAEGKAQGPLAAALAEKTAAAARKQAYDQADTLEREASKQADGILAEAKRQSDQVMEEGRKKSQSL